MILQLINYIKYNKESKLTKQQRNNIYKRTLKCIEERSRTCICPGIRYYSKFEYYKILNVEDNFIEIIKHKPLLADTNRMWWSDDEKGRQIRIKVLKQAIKETNP